MYHIQDKNQVKLEKNLNKTRFSRKDSQFEEQFLQILRNSVKVRPIKLSNKYFADRMGCCTKTITRITNKLHKAGLITKHQENRYAPNHFTLNEKRKNGVHDYSKWVNSLSSKNQDLFISHGIRIDHNNKVIFSLGNVPHYKSINLILDSLSSKNVVSYAHTRDNINKKIKRILKKGIKMNAIQKQMILNQRNHPNIKEIVSSPKIMEKIITPIIEKIVTTLTLDEKEQFKLVAFTEETLEHVYAEIEYSIKSKKVPHIPNRMEWILLFATQYCAVHNIKPDWKWYYELCDILGISTKTEKKPFTIQATSYYTPKSKPQVSSYDQMAKLEHELMKREERLSIYGGSLLDKRTIENLKQKINTLRESSNEKQSILYQNSSNSMATCSA